MTKPLITMAFAKRIAARRLAPGNRVCAEQDRELPETMIA